MHYLAIWLIIFGLPLLSFSQRQTAESIFLNSEQGSERFSLVDNNKSLLKPSPSLNYFWFKAGRIFSTEGGIGGKALHGKYTKFYRSGQLWMQGEFKLGLKHGSWFTWTSKGNLMTLERWKKGQLHGKVLQYNDTEACITESNYRKGLLHGEKTTFINDSIIGLEKYRYGKLHKTNTDRKGGAIEKIEKNRSKLDIFKFSKNKQGSEK